jgi:hypothetical protein
MTAFGSARPAVGSAALGSAPKPAFAPFALCAVFLGTTTSALQVLIRICLRARTGAHECPLEVLSTMQVQGVALRVPKVGRCEQLEAAQDGEQN